LISETPINEGLGERLAEFIGIDSK